MVSLSATMETKKGLLNWLADHGYIVTGRPMMAAYWQARVIITNIVWQFRHGAILAGSLINGDALTGNLIMAQH